MKYVFFTFVGIFAVIGLKVFIASVLDGVELEYEVLEQ